MEEKCEKLIEEINTQLFSGIHWFKLVKRGNFIFMVDPYDTKLFAEFSYDSLYADIAAFLYGVKYGISVEVTANNALSQEI